MEQNYVIVALCILSSTTIFNFKAPHFAAICCAVNFTFTVRSKVLKQSRNTALLGQK